MKNFKIVAVRPIFNAKGINPMVVIDVVGFEKGIVRTPKMILIDLHNSGRALSIPENAFDGLPRQWNAFDKEDLIDALHECVGAEVSGDITPVKAGDKYIVDANSSVVKNKNNPLYGKYKIGESAPVQKDGMRVVGFLTIAKTMEERQVRANAREYARTQTRMFGASSFGASSSGSSSSETPEFEENETNDFEEFEDVEETADAVMEKATGKKGK
jgi:hypothetical protein